MWLYVKRVNNILTTLVEGKLKAEEKTVLETSRSGLKLHLNVQAKQLIVTCRVLCMLTVEEKMTLLGYSGNAMRIEGENQATVQRHKTFLGV